MKYLLIAIVLLAAVPLSAQQVIVTQAQVDGWVQVWQKQLSLEPWRIEACIVRQSDLKPDTLGHLKWSSQHTATIYVLDPRDYSGMTSDAIADDIQTTVIHELVHLELSVLPRDPLHKDVEESVVNSIVKALRRKTDSK